MSCDRIREWIDAYLDSELDPASVRLVEEHVATCNGCRTLIDSRRELSFAIKQAVTYVSAPSGLGVSVRRERRTPVRRFGPIALGFAVALCAASAIFIWYPRPTPSDRLVSDLMADHRQSTSRLRKVDLESSELAKITPWFESKGLGYCPTLPDIKSSGFKLIGGRIDMSEGRQVATLVYTRNNKVIDLFVTPPWYADPINADREGVHVRTWESCGLDFWAVSEGDPSDLVDLHSMFPTRSR